jgi:hypothetical protein
MLTHFRSSYEEFGSAIKRAAAAIPHVSGAAANHSNYCEITRYPFTTVIPIRLDALHMVAIAISVYGEPFFQRFSVKEKIWGDPYTAARPQLGNVVRRVSRCWRGGNVGMPVEDF